MISKESEEQEPDRTDREATGVNWSAVTDVGRFRKNNEDAFLALEMDAREVRYLGKFGEATFENGDFIFAVSDGMGGHNAGEFASRIAVEKITQLLPTAFRLEAQGLQRDAPDLLEQLVQDIHEEVKRLGEAYEELEGMGATLSLSWISPGYLHFCHIGDSRIYLLPEAEGIKQITEDHTHVGWLLRTGQINATQARFHPLRNQLSQSLNARSRNLRPQIGAVRYEVGDRFVICSDGLNEGLSDNNIDHFLRNCPDKYADLTAAESIVKESVANSGRDNTTAVVVEIV